MSRFRAIAASLVLAAGLAACGDDSSSDGGQEEEARQAVIDTIAAYDKRDFHTVCDLLDARGTSSITKLAKTDTCPEAYEKLFANQAKFSGDGQAFTDFANLLQEYEVGDAEITDDGAEVALTGGPQGPATAFLVDEDGTLKVSELFVTPDANTNPEQYSPGG